MFIHFQRFVFQTNEGGEFADKYFFEAFRRSQNQHQLACPNPPKNDFVEQKHGNITELGLTMLFHFKLRIRYWVYCFATIIYLINRLPSPMIWIESPFF